MKKTIAVAVSGGIDSLVSAFLLKSQGYHVLGIHFITGYESIEKGKAEEPSHIDRIQEMTDRLGIDLIVKDIKPAFDQYVVDYFAKTYMAGQTPNPCLACNPAIKFGVILSHAKSLGATRLATGHYAVSKEIKPDEYGLFKGADIKKDQSYFLARLTQSQLSEAVFPLGDMTKTQTRKIAKKNHLNPVTKDESQDICFIKNTTYGDFLANQKKIDFKPGPIVDTSGRVIGEHKGLHLYTIGQRRGLDCPSSQAYYVLKIDAANNRLVVGFRDETYAPSCTVSHINWINGPPTSSIETMVKIRYRHRAVPAVLIPKSDTTGAIEFDSPQMAVTPGQGAVFYDQTRVLGGGWINR